MVGPTKTENENKIYSFFPQNKQALVFLYLDEMVTMCLCFIIFSNRVLDSTTGPAPTIIV